MSDAQRVSDDELTELEIDVPADPLAGHPASAYFWGHVAGSGDVSDEGGAVRSGAKTAQIERQSRDRIVVVTGDETAARVLAAIVGESELEHDTTSREFAHDASITRTADEFTIAIGTDDGGDLLGRRTALGFPVDGRGNYRFGAFSEYDRELLRGLLESCGTICFKSSSGTVGISFVHTDRELLELIRELIADCAAERSSWTAEDEQGPSAGVPTGDISETSSGGYWFGVDDAAAPAFGRWLYEDCEETGLFAPSRRRKLEKSLERAEAYGE